MPSDTVRKLRDVRDAQVALAWESYDTSLEALGLRDEPLDAVSLAEQRVLAELAREALLSRILQQRSDEWRRCAELAPSLSFESWRGEIVRSGCVELPRSLKGAESRVLRWLDRPLRFTYESCRNGGR